MPVTVLRCESDHRDLSFFPPLSPQQRAWHININVLDAKLLQSCLTLCNPMDYSPPGSSVHGDSPGKNTGVDCHALLEGIFPTQESNPGLPHDRQTL